MPHIETGRYTSGYVIVDPDKDTPENHAACERLAEEVAVLYRSIPVPSDPEDEDPREEAFADYLDTLNQEEQAAAIARRKADTAAKWAQIEAIEELLDVRGAALYDPSRGRDD
jgi:hypothetical protein